MKTWKLFLEDIREVKEGFILARSVAEAVDLINKNGFPIFISFDHDLGENVPTGKDFVNLIVDNVLDNNWVIEKEFQYFIHSDNPVGAENIRNYLNSFLKNQGINFSLKRNYKLDLE